MASTSLTVLYNPAAARGRAARRIAVVQEVFKRAGLPHRLEASAGRGDIERAARRAAAAGATRLVVAGGDGSIHEAVNGLMPDASGTALGIVPLGTGNDIAKACDLPLNAEDAAEMLADRILNDVPVRSIDVGCMNERYFVNSAGIGFDARVSAIAERNRWPIGDLVYLAAVLHGLVDGVSTPSLKIESHGELREGPVTLVSISNGTWVGGLFPIAPPARNDDGRLDLVVVDSLSRLGMLALLPLLIRGHHLAHRAVSHVPVTECRITAAEPLISHLDGETQAAATEFDVRILPGALNLL